MVFCVWVTKSASNLGDEVDAITVTKWVDKMVTKQDGEETTYMSWSASSSKIVMPAPPNYHF